MASAFPAMGDEVLAATPACIRQGCQFSQASRVLDQAHHALTQETRYSMSQALWCDQGGHAFSERDPGRQRIAVSVLNEETEQEERVTKDFCGECAKSAGLTTGRRTRPQAIQASAE